MSTMFCFVLILPSRVGSLEKLTINKSWGLVSVKTQLLPSYSLQHDSKIELGVTCEAESVG